MLTVSIRITVMTYLKELPPISLHDPLMRWSCELAWQIKYIISPSPENPWTPNNTWC